MTTRDGIVNKDVFVSSVEENMKQASAEENVIAENDDVLESKLKVKCGEVFALFGERFILVCTFCSTSFKEMQLLGEHLLHQHTEEFIQRDTDDPVTAPEIHIDLMKIHNESTDALSCGDQRSSRRKCRESNRNCAIKVRGKPKKQDVLSMEEIKDIKGALLPQEDGLTYGSRISCDTCGVSYKNRRNLVRHQRDSSCKERILQIDERQEDANAGIEKSLHVVIDEKIEIAIKSNENQFRNEDPLEESTSNQVLETISSQDELCERIPIIANLNPVTPANESQKPHISVEENTTETMDADQETSFEKNSTDSYTCNICFQKCNSEQRFQHHLLSHGVDIQLTVLNTDLFCEYCNRQFESKKALTNHQRRHKRNINTKDQALEDVSENEINVPKNPDLHCDLCNRYFRNRQSLYSHADSHDIAPKVLQIDADYLKCKYCHKAFSKYAERRKHESTHSGPRPYECPYCHKGFVSNMSRKSHYRIHTGESPHQCKQCMKVFRDNYDLRRHIKRHLNIRDVACKLCDKKFYHKHQLELHMRTHTKERPYVCEDCGKTFVVLPQLKDHQLRHTGIKNVKCDICDRLFYSKSVLKVHMASHSDEKPFECNVCGRRFSRAKAMQKHMKLHSGIKRYVCNICGKAYAQDSGLYAHKKTHARQLE